MRLVYCRSLWTHVYRQLAWYYMVAKSIEDDKWKGRLFTPYLKGMDVLYTVNFVPSQYQTKSPYWTYRTVHRKQVYDYRE
jgi:hypothetical protein